MARNDSFGRRHRLRRLYRHGGGLLVVPLDHSLTEGPVTGSLDELLGQLADNGADAVVLHRGSLRHADPRRFDGTSLIVHLSGGTARGLDPDAKCPVATVEGALRVGADAVSVHVNLGSLEEQRQLADLGAVGEACDRWQLPLLAMVYPRGPLVTDPHDPALVAHAAAVAADLGADLVKTVFPGSVAALTEITRACPIPVLIAGGAVRGDADTVAAFVTDCLRGGAAGVAMGRNIFQSDDPGAMTRAIADLVHGNDVLSMGVRNEAVLA